MYENYNMQELLSRKLIRTEKKICRESFLDLLKGHGSRGSSHLTNYRLETILNHPPPSSFYFDLHSLSHSTSPFPFFPSSSSLRATSAYKPTNEIRNTRAELSRWTFLRPSFRPSLIPLDSTDNGVSLLYLWKKY